MLVYSKGHGDANFKSIVRPERVSWVCSPHYCIYNKGICHCTPSNKPVLPPFVEIGEIRINHYWTRDEWYLENIKIPRRDLWGTPPHGCRLWASLANANYDPAIFRFIEPLRQRVFK
jgi:hypothetical protein